MATRLQFYRFGRLTLVAVLLATLFAIALGTFFRQIASASSAELKSGEQIYKSACSACHGADGKGTSKSISVFQQPRTFPDFTRCDQTTPEDNYAWKAVIVNGGQYRGFSQIMPSFGEALTSSQINQVIRYLRTFCRSPHWPRGELNLPRALVTEKAYPEDEVVISTAINAQRAPGVASHIIHEQRFGVKNQVEVDVPITFQDESHTWYGGVGDTTFGVKRVMFSSLRSGSILSLQGSVIVPSGNKARRFGTGTTTFETFAAYGQLFPTNTFIQAQFGADLSHHTLTAPQSIFFNCAVGQSFAGDHHLGRLWTPMMESIAERDLVASARTNWDVLPQMQITISHRQHVRGDLGVRIPVSNTAGRSAQVTMYLLWDWQDGHLNEGW